MKTTIVLGLMASVSVSTSTLANTYKVTKIHDGDTISVVDLQDNSASKVRLACIDSPEAQQPQGKLSTETLKTFIPVGTNVELNIVDTDRYGRSVAEVLKNGINLNQFMLLEGQAVVYRRYLSNCPDRNSYIEAEKLAKERKLGFWNDSTFITPQNWRRGERPRRSSSTRTTSNPNSNDNGRYIAGSCKYLKSLGLSRFTPGDPNYTSRRDRDNDGVACE